MPVRVRLLLDILMVQYGAYALKRHYGRITGPLRFGAGRRVSASRQEN